MARPFLARFANWINPFAADNDRPLHDHGIPCRHPDAKRKGFNKCECAERMGNDFYFLPADRCLWDSK